MRKSNDHDRVNLYVDKRLKQNLEREAEERGLSLNKHIISVLERHRNLDDWERFAIYTLHKPKKDGVAIKRFLTELAAKL